MMTDYTIEIINSQAKLVNLVGNLADVSAFALDIETMTGGTARKRESRLFKSLSAIIRMTIRRSKSPSSTPSLKLIWKFYAFLLNQIKALK